MITIVCDHISNLRGMRTLSRKTALSKVYTHLKRGSSKRKEFSPLSSKFFPFRVDLVQNKTGVQESKQEDTNVVSDVTNGQYSTKYINPLTLVMLNKLRCHTHL